MDQQTIDTYNKLAKEYDEETADFWADFPRDFIDKFVGPVPNEKTLNLGSGPGRDAVILREKGIDQTCLDASDTMVAITKKLGFDSIKADILEMPFPDGHFSAVWAYTSLLHVSKKDLGKALDEIKRVLKNGGIFAIGMIEGETEGYKESSGVQAPRLFSLYTESELRKALIDHSFEIAFFDTFKPRSKTYLNFITRKV